MKGFRLNLFLKHVALQPLHGPDLFIKQQPVDLLLTFCRTSNICVLDLSQNANGQLYEYRKLLYHNINTVKLFNFMGTKCRDLTTLDMCVNTCIRGFQITCNDL